MNPKQKTKNDLITPQNPLLVTTRVKILLTFLVCLVVSLLAVFITRELYVQSVTNRSETMSTLLDPERTTSLITNGDEALTDSAYIKRQLQQTRGVNTDIQRLYLLTATPRGDVYYLVDSESPGSKHYATRGQSFPKPSEALKATLYSGQSFVFGPTKNQLGTVLTVVSPVYNQSGSQIAIIAMDIHPSSYYSVLAMSVLIPVFLALLASAVFLATDTIRKRRQESIRMRSELVSIASHELRTPLTGIRWSEESLLSSELMGESREVLQTMYDSTLRLQESIEDILQLANWQAGRKQELIKTTTDIGSMFEGIFATQKLPAAQKNIHLEFAPKWPKKLLIDCDGQRMKRVLNNLISNAIKYSKANTAVTVGHQKVDGKHLITIKDHGIGIPATEQDKVFAGFYRASNAVAKESSGTGMGLYMSRSAVEQHGGKLWLVSEEGKGTTVFIQLP